METEKLIAALAKDAGPPQQSPARVRFVAGAVAVLVAFGAFMLFVGPRSDIEAAAQTPRFLLKPALTLLLFTAAFVNLASVMRPGADLGPRRFALLVPPLLLGLAVVAELAILPPVQWAPRLIGTNAILCLTVLPALAFGPLAVFLWALRQGAPTAPDRAGALAGLAAAGLGATFYALNCTDDSPLFVAVWYPIATAIVVGAGTLAGRRWLRW